MAVVLETSLGDLVIDLHTDQAPRTCLNFLKLCKLKYYNNCLFHSVQKDFLAQTGDPTGTGKGGQCVWNVVDKTHSRFFESEIHPKLSHNKIGVVSMACFEGNKDKLGSQFLITLSADLKRLDKGHTIFGEVAEGFETLSKINESFVDDEDRPMRNIRIRHCIIIDDPFDDNAVPNLVGSIPEHSPSPQLDQYDVERIRDDEAVLEDGKNDVDLIEEVEHLQAKSDGQILVMVNDIPDADAAPPDNVLFVCRLNAMTESEDLRIIFSQHGKIRNCDVVRDWKTGDSLQYAFIEYEEVADCQRAYMKMENVLIDDRRIHVDFSQSVAKYYWHHHNKGKFESGNKKHQPRVEEANRRGNGRGRGGDRNRDKGDRRYEKGGGRRMAMEFESVVDDAENRESRKMKRRKEQDDEYRNDSERKRDRKKDRNRDKDRHSRDRKGRRDKEDSAHRSHRNRREHYRERSRSREREYRKYGRSKR